MAIAQNVEFKKQNRNKKRIAQFDRPRNQT